MSKLALLESLLIGQSGFFGLVLAGGPVLFIYQNEIIGNLEKHEELEAREEEKKKIEEKAERAREILDDYSFKIFLPCNSNGTGWILDFEIPEPGHYPTKWYIATNIHVAKEFKFAEDNYGQTLPRPKSDNSKSKLFLNIPLNSNEACQLSEDSDYFDFNLSKQKNGRQLRANYGAIHSNRMKEPKLFYAPIDFLKRDPSVGVREDNYKDFAVIEVEFNTETDARETTDNFYEKYGTGKKAPLNVFASPWEKDKNKVDSEVNLYTLGYEWIKAFNYTFAFKKETSLTPKLGKRVSEADSEGRINSLGFDYGKLKVLWNDKFLHRVGHSYLLNHLAMWPGSSGGLVIDEDANLWAIRSIGRRRQDQALVVPLRSQEIKEAHLKTPAYDLILGGFPNQKTSYKQQVKEHVLKYGKETWLSQRSNWRNT